MEDVPSLADTTWDGRDQYNEYSIVTFLKNGEIAFYDEKSGSHFNRADSWTQNGNYVRIIYSSGYAVFTGTINNDEILGNAVNKTGLKWTWRLIKKNQFIPRP